MQTTGIGYIFNFEGHGAYHPGGKCSEPLSQDQIDAHNKALAQLELADMVERGKGILYLTGSGVRWQVSQWAGGFSGYIHRQAISNHNMAGKDGRTDVWFTGPDGKEWHGVNIGDNQICRVHRLKHQ